MASPHSTDGKPRPTQSHTCCPSRPLGGMGTRPWPRPSAAKLSRARPPMTLFLRKDADDRQRPRAGGERFKRTSWPRCAPAVCQAGTHLLALWLPGKRMGSNRNSEATPVTSNPRARGRRWPGHMSSHGNSLIIIIIGIIIIFMKAIAIMTDSQTLLMFCLF